MRAPAFWWREERGLAARALMPLGALLGGLVLRRMARDGARAGVPVICVGNPVAGGAGKTPVVRAVAARLIAMGRRPAIVLRGYGGRESGPLQVEERHGTADVGDEAQLLMRDAATFVARNRLAGAMAARDAGADVVLLDDGFQNPALAKDLSLLVVDAAAGIGNGLCIPAGPLRAPLVPQLRRARAVVLAGVGAPGEAVARLAHEHGLAVLRASLEPDPEAAATLAGRRVVAFAGIGRPGKFADTLKALGADVVELVELDDHAAPSPREARHILATAARHGAHIVMTEKDAVKLRGQAHLAGLAEVAMALPVRMAFANEAALDALLAEALSRGSGPAP